MVCHDTFFQAPCPPISSNTGGNNGGGNPFKNWSSGDPNCASCGGNSNGSCVSCQSTTQYDPCACDTNHNSCETVNPLISLLKSITGNMFDCMDTDAINTLLKSAECWRLKCSCDSDMSVIYAVAHLYQLQQVSSAQSTGYVVAAMKGRGIRQGVGKGSSHWDWTVWGELYQSLKKQKPIPALAGMG